MEETAAKRIPLQKDRSRTAVVSEDSNVTEGQAFYRAADILQVITLLFRLIICHCPQNVMFSQLFEFATASVVLPWWPKLGSPEVGNKAVPSVCVAF